MSTEADMTFTQSFDARDWAKAFVEIAQKNPAIATDEGTMIGWFANAIMRGYDDARAKYEPIPAVLPTADAPTAEELVSLCGRLAREYKQFDTEIARQCAPLFDWLASHLPSLLAADADRQRMESVAKAAMVYHDAKVAAEHALTEWRQGRLSYNDAQEVSDRVKFAPLAAAIRAARCTSDRETT